MASSIEVDDGLFEKIERLAVASGRSVSEQMSYYFNIASIGSDNPELSYALIREILLAKDEKPAGEYQLGSD